MSNVFGELFSDHKYEILLSSSLFCMCGVLFWIVCQLKLWDSQLLHEMCEMINECSLYSGIYKGVHTVWQRKVLWKQSETVLSS